MRAGEAGWLLSAIAREREVELDAGQEAWVDELVRRGLLRDAPDPGPERARLESLRQELAAVGRQRVFTPGDVALVGRERALRTEILGLSEQIAKSESAAALRRTGGGPYRGGFGAVGRVALTQRGRALLSDLGPRHARAQALELDAFEAEMTALRAAFDQRAARAALVGTTLRAGAALGHAQNSVLVGLSALRAEPARAAMAFDAAFGNVERMLAVQAPADRAAAAECLCLAVEDVAHAHDPRLATQLVAMIHDLVHRFRVAFEDALDATAILSHAPMHDREPRIALANELSVALRARGRAISLTYALLATTDHRVLPPHLPSTLAYLDEVLAREVSDPAERMATAVLVAFPRVDHDAQLARWRVIRQYLARVSPDGMSVAAALLAWLSLEPEEILDHLRLASQALARHGIAGTGAETVTTASKLLLAMAALASGAEGDPEERLALAPQATPGLAHVGLQGTLAALPLAAVSAFHHTVLSVAAAWERTYHPTHTSYVHGRSSYYRG